MAERCAAAGVVLMEAMMARFNPQHVRVRQLIAAGVIGDVGLFSASFTVRLTEPKANIRFLSAPGAGALFDVGIYPISVARWDLGVEPVEVKALTTELPGTGADQVSTVMMRFGERGFGVIDCGLTLEPRNRYEVVGSEGMIAVTRPFASPPFVATAASLDLVITRAGPWRSSGSRTATSTRCNWRRFMASSLEKPHIRIVQTSPSRRRASSMPVTPPGPLDGITAAS
jgi:predicted dehydrogenase